MNSESPFKGNTGWYRLVNAPGYSRDGLLSAWRYEVAVDQTSLDRQHLAERAKDLGSAAQLVSLTALSLVSVLALSHR